MFRFNETTLQFLQNAGWSEDRHASLADEYVKALENEGFCVSIVVKNFLYNFGGLTVYHPHAKIKEKTDYFHFDVIKALNSGDTDWVSEEYSSRIGKELCIIGEAFRRAMILCMSPDKEVYAGIDENLFYIGNSGESAIESLCNGNELEEIPAYYANSSEKISGYHPKVETINVKFRNYNPNPKNYREINNIMNLNIEQRKTLQNKQNRLSSTY